MTQGEKVGRGDSLAVIRETIACSTEFYEDQANDVLVAIKEGRVPGVVTRDTALAMSSSACEALQKEVAELRGKVGDATRVTTDAMEMANAAEKRAQKLMRERDEALSTLEFMNDQKDALLHALEEGRRIAKERDEARGLLSEAVEELRNHQFSDDGEYNNDKVIRMIDRIDAFLGTFP